VRELLPAVGTARTSTDCPVSARSALNNSEHVDTVSPTGLTRRTVIEHGGHDTGTVGLSVTVTDRLDSFSSSRPLTKLSYSASIYIPVKVDTVADNSAKNYKGE